MSLACPVSLWRCSLVADGQQFITSISFCAQKHSVESGFGLTMSSVTTRPAKLFLSHLRHKATSWIAFPPPTRWIKALGFHYCFKSGDWKRPGIWNIASRTDFNSSGWWIGSANGWGIPVSHKQIISLRPLIGNRLYWSRLLFFGQSANNFPAFLIGWSCQDDTMRTFLPASDDWFSLHISFD